MSNLLFFPFATELISKFQYVKTSTIIIIAGLMIIAVNLSKNNIKLWGGYILVIFGCRIRFESFIAAGALSAFTLLMYFFKLEEKQKIVAVKQMVILFILVFSLEGINSLYYTKNPQWAEYTAYNKARTNLTDYKENYIPLYFNDVINRGFSENDVHLIYSGNYFDNTFFDTETINIAADSIGKKPVKDIIADYLHIVINLFINVNEKFYKIGFILSIILLFTCKRESFIYRFGTMTMFALLLLYLMTVNRFMSRIEAMMVIAATVNVAMCYAPAEIKNIKMSTISGITVILIILLSLPVQLQYRKGKHNSYVEASTKYEDIVQDMSAQKENLYLFDSVQTDYFAGYDVFTPRGVDFFSNICPTGSWYSNSIYTNRVLERFNIESPLIDSVNRSDIFISNEHIDLKLKYVQEHYNENVYAVKVTENGLCDYQFKMN
ncbi:MAG: hypothetical protein IKJ05_05385 [Oscillospiraceae bacterium]|nr:hypothetical protein [Oscillospiraceae bacterium]